MAHSPKSNLLLQSLKARNNDIVTVRNHYIFTMDGWIRCNVVSNSSVVCVEKMAFQSGILYYVFHVVNICMDEFFPLLIVPPPVAIRINCINHIFPQLQEATF